VVVMETALYGRMRLGTCVVADLGFVGCSRDVLSVLDERCSGRRRCTLRVPDQDLAALRPQPCLTELKSYLEASYRCQKGQLRSLCHPLHMRQLCLIFLAAATPTPYTACISVCISICLSFCLLSALHC